jgi:hypothetical protein
MIIRSDLVVRLELYKNEMKLCSLYYMLFSGN